MLLNIYSSSCTTKTSSSSGKRRRENRELNIIKQLHNNNVVNLR